jgi:hypothetical protein
MFDAQKYERYAVAPHGRLKAQQVATAADEDGPVTVVEKRASRTMTFERVLDRAIAKAQWSRLALHQAAKHRLRDIAVLKRKTLRIRSLRYWIAQQEAADISVLTLIALRSNLSISALGSFRKDAPSDISFATPASEIEQLIEGHAPEPILTYERAVAEAFQVRARIHSLLRADAVPDAKRLDRLCREQEHADTALIDAARAFQPDLSDSALVGKSAPERRA